MVVVVAVAADDVVLQGLASSVVVTVMSSADVETGENLGLVRSAPDPEA